MNNSSKKKNDVLGMPFGTASARLKKQIMFMLIKKLGEDICYRCGTKIESVDELSVEHKKGWLNSENPQELFWDIENNVAFSHLNCNTAHQEYRERDKLSDVELEERRLQGIENRKEWKRKNKEKDREWQRENYKKRYSSDAKYREDKINRNRLYEKSGTSSSN